MPSNPDTSWEGNVSLCTEHIVLFKHSKCSYFQKQSNAFLILQGLDACVGEPGKQLY